MAQLVQQQPREPMGQENQIWKRQENIGNSQDATRDDFDQAQSCRPIRLKQNGTNSKLGFSLRGGKEATGSSVGVFVSHIELNGQANRNGLKVGDQLVQVNGLQVSQATYDEVIELIKRTPKSDEIRLLVRYAGLIPFQEKSGEPIKWLKLDNKTLPPSDNQPNRSNDPLNHHHHHNRHHVNYNQHQRMDATSCLQIDPAAQQVDFNRQTSTIEIGVLAKNASRPPKTSMKTKLAPPPPLPPSSYQDDSAASSQSLTFTSSSLSSASSSANEEDEDETELREEAAVHEDQEICRRSKVATSSSSSYSSSSTSSGCSISMSSMQSGGTTESGKRATGPPPPIISGAALLDSGDLDAQADLLGATPIRVPGGRRTNKTFGCGVVKGPDEWPGIFVQHVKPASLAERVGLQPGDELVSADQHLLAHMAFEEAIALIKRLQAQQDELLLRIRKGAALEHLAKCKQHQQAPLNQGPAAPVAGGETRSDRQEEEEEEVDWRQSGASTEPICRQQAAVGGSTQAERQDELSSSVGRASQSGECNDREQEQSIGSPRHSSSAEQLCNSADRAYSISAIVAKAASRSATVSQARQAPNRLRPASQSKAGANCLKTEMSTSPLSLQMMEESSELAKAPLDRGDNKKMWRASSRQASSPSTELAERSRELNSEEAAPTTTTPSPPRRLTNRCSPGHQLQRRHHQNLQAPKAAPEASTATVEIGPGPIPSSTTDCRHSFTNLDISNAAGLPATGKPLAATRKHSNGLPSASKSDDTSSPGHVNQISAEGGDCGERHQENRMAYLSGADRVSEQIYCTGSVGGGVGSSSNAHEAQMKKTPSDRGVVAGAVMRRQQTNGTEISLAKVAASKVTQHRIGLKQEERGEAQLLRFKCNRSEVDERSFADNREQDQEHEQGLSECEEEEEDQRDQQEEEVEDEEEDERDGQEEIKIVSQNCKLHHHSLHSLVKSSLFVNERYCQKQLLLSNNNNISHEAQHCKQPLTSPTTEALGRFKAEARQQRQKQQQAHKSELQPATASSSRSIQMNSAGNFSKQASAFQSASRVSELKFSGHDLNLSNISSGRRVQPGPALAQRYVSMDNLASSSHRCTESRLSNTSRLVEDSPASKSQQNRLKAAGGKSQFSSMSDSTCQRQRGAYRRSNSVLGQSQTQFSASQLVVQASGAATIGQASCCSVIAPRRPEPTTVMTNDFCDDLSLLPQQQQRHYRRHFRLQKAANMFAGAGPLRMQAMACDYAKCSAATDDDDAGNGNDLLSCRACLMKALLIKPTRLPMTAATMRHFQAQPSQCHAAASGAKFKTIKQQQQQRCQTLGLSKFKARSEDKLNLMNINVNYVKIGQLSQQQCLASTGDGGAGSGSSTYRSPLGVAAHEASSSLSSKQLGAHTRRLLLSASNGAGRGGSPLLVAPLPPHHRQQIQFCCPNGRAPTTSCLAPSRSHQHQQVYNYATATGLIERAKQEGAPLASGYSMVKPLRTAKSCCAINRLDIGHNHDRAPRPLGADCSSRSCACNSPQCLRASPAMRPSSCCARDERQQLAMMMTMVTAAQQKQATKRKSTTSGQGNCGGGGGGASTDSSGYQSAGREYLGGGLCPALASKHRPAAQTQQTSQRQQQQQQQRDTSLKLSTFGPARPASGGMRMRAPPPPQAPASSNRFGNHQVDPSGGACDTSDCSPTSPSSSSSCSALSCSPPVSSPSAYTIGQHHKRRAPTTDSSLLSLSSASLTTAASTDSSHSTGPSRSPSPACRPPVTKRTGAKTASGRPTQAPVGPTLQPKKKTRSAALYGQHEQASGASNKSKSKSKSSSRLVQEGGHQSDTIPRPPPMPIVGADHTLRRPDSANCCERRPNANSGPAGSSKQQWSRANNRTQSAMVEVSPQYCHYNNNNGSHPATCQQFQRHEAPSKPSKRSGDNSDRVQSQRTAPVGALASEQQKLSKTGAGSGGGKKVNRLCFVDELKMLASGIGLGGQEGTSRATAGAAQLSHAASESNQHHNQQPQHTVDSSTLIKIINANKLAANQQKQQQASCVSCCRSAPGSSACQAKGTGACRYDAMQPSAVVGGERQRRAADGGARIGALEQHKSAQSKSVKLRDEEDNKRRQHELLMEEFKTAHSKMFNKLRQQTDNNSAGTASNANGNNLERRDNDSDDDVDDGDGADYGGEGGTNNNNNNNADPKSNANIMIRPRTSVAG